jgi:hypothetical protein
MNVHAFRSDELASACKKTVEREEKLQRQRQRQRCLMQKREDWWRYSDGAFATKIICTVITMTAVVVPIVFIVNRYDDISAMQDKLACFRVCPAPLVDVEMKYDKNGNSERLCICYRKDGVRAEFLSKQQYKKLRKP